MLTRRTPWVLVLAAVVLLGALDLHLAGESHELLGAGGDETYSRSAKHPNAPAHFEQFEAGQRPSCPFCLHQLRTSGAHLQMVSRLATPTLAGFGGLVADPLVRERFAAPRPARGPPAA
ncbi:MAG TPA: hypothetical protein VLV54_17270 [Thermoanaerobaculia bacterium]|nr:hypothetical protein [Thermoanaerobaculia bacterium]